MSELIYREGDLFADLPLIKMDTVVAHVVSDTGAFGAGFAAGVATHHPVVKHQYQSSYQGYALGDIQYCYAGEINSFTLEFANLFAQHGLRSKTNIQPLSYAHLQTTLWDLAQILSYEEDPIQVWAPKLGCGLGGGSWPRIEEIINKTLVAADVRTVIYSLPTPGVSAAA